MIDAPEMKPYDPDWQKNTDDIIQELTAKLKDAEDERDHACNVADREETRAEAAEAKLAEVEAERDEHAANAAAISEMAAEIVEEMSQKRPTPTWGQVKGAIRVLGDLGDRQIYRDIIARAEATDARERDAYARGFKAALERADVGVQSLCKSDLTEGEQIALMAAVEIIRAIPLPDTKGDDT